MCPGNDWIMRTLAKKVARRILCIIPLGAWQRLIPRHEFVFCYHLACDRRLPHLSNIYEYKTARMFADDLDYIQGHFEIVDFRELLRRRVQKETGGRPAAMITFDDGLAEAFTIARPILKERKIPAVFFIITDLIDNRAMFYRHKASLCIERFRAAENTARGKYLQLINTRYKQNCADLESVSRFILSHRADRAEVVDELCEMLEVDIADYLAQHQPYMTTEQIKTLQSEGFTIGAHTTDHLDFQNLTPEQIELQIVESCTTITELTGVTPVPFAFPFTMRGLDRDMLWRIVHDNPVIGPLFGTSGLMVEPPFIHRIFSDDPIGSRPGKSNIPRLLSGQYKMIFVESH